MTYTHIIWIFLLLCSFQSCTTQSPTVKPQIGTVNVTCDINGTLQCLKEVATHPSLQMFVLSDFTNVTESDIDTLCRVMENAYYCIGTKLDTCSPQLLLIRDVVLSASRYICNGDKTEFVRVLGCFMELESFNTSNMCLGGKIDEFRKIFTGEMDIFTDSTQFCSVYSDYLKCYMDSLSTTCTDADYGYVYHYMKSAFQPVNENLQCDVTSGLAAPTTGGGPDVGTGNDTCDIGAMSACLMAKDGNFPALQMFTTSNFKNITDIGPVCIDLQTAYNCIGTKLDSCSADLKLWRDVVLAGARYICNGDTAAFAGMAGCFDKIQAANITITNCLGEQTAEMGKYFRSELSVYSNSSHFCNLANIWTKCYLDSVQSYCSENEYQFMYDYMKVAYQPVTDAIQCDMLSDVSEPTTTENSQGVGNVTTTEGVQETTTTAATSGQESTTSGQESKKCRYVGRAVSGRRKQRLDKWCTKKCRRGNCPTSVCKCDEGTTIERICVAKGRYHKIKGMDGWCAKTCAGNYCPKSICKCKPKKI